jgi:hypothetical protein
MSVATLVLGTVPAGASAAVTLDGSFSVVATKPTADAQTNPFCPSGVADECGTMELVGRGVADWAYDFGPTFEPNGRCFDVDGTFTLALQSDGSAVSGPLTGLFCPDPSETGHSHRSQESWGNPFSEDDTIAFAGGTGQFDGLSGTASFHTRAAGASIKGTLKGTLTG